MKDALNSYQLMVEEVGPDVAMEIALLIPNMPSMANLKRVWVRHCGNGEISITIDTDEHGYRYLVGVGRFAEAALLLGTSCYVRTMIIQQKLTRLEKK